MPALRYFIVTQVREVKVSATKTVDAALLATRVLNGEMKPEDQLSVQAYPREVDLRVQEESILNRNV